MSVHIETCSNLLPSGCVGTALSAFAATRSRRHLCPVLNCAMYSVCESILSIRNRASGLLESSRRALVADAMEDSPDQMHSLLTPGSVTGTESVALPSLCPAHRYHASPDFHQYLKNCIATYLPSRCSLEWVPAFRRCVARVSVRSPAALFAQENLSIVLEQGLPAGGRPALCTELLSP